MTLTPQFGDSPNCQVSRERDTRRHNCCLELDFRRAVWQVPCRQRPDVRAWLRRYRRHRTRVFHQLDPATGHWRRL